SIAGFVWHDVCALTGQPAISAATGEEPPEDNGCVVAEDGTYIGNGLFELGEPGIRRVLVAVSPGEDCTADPILTTTTRRNGYFSFAGLEPGTYCVFVPAGEDSPNADRLLPGRWSYPDASGSVIVTIEEGNPLPEVAFFGWDYDLLPDTTRSPLRSLLGIGGSRNR
ncbi:MAG TPA: SdrD B-like domain-containing protein, partial [Aggregatilineales bacterium]|nr:SdrD B-like domain-containing protein [Aggregatilineales bacterium]